MHAAVRTTQDEMQKVMLLSSLRSWFCIIFLYVPADHITTRKATPYIKPGSKPGQWIY